MRLIDADALIENIKRVCCTDCNSYEGVRCRACWADDAMSMADDAPEIDAVPVIHCAACAWRSATGFCGRHGHPVSDDFFCAYGTTEIIRKPGPAKKTEKKAEERCLATGGLCSKCTPGPCDHRRTVIPDDSGQ